MRAMSRGQVQVRCQFTLVCGLPHGILQTAASIDSELHRLQQQAVERGIPALDKAGRDQDRTINIGLPLVNPYVAFTRAIW